MHAQPARWILIDKWLPHFLPVGLAVALRTAHRRPEIFHAGFIVPVALLDPPQLAGEGRVGAADQSGIGNRIDSIMVT
jgi:hypothetical protein